MDLEPSKRVLRLLVSLAIFIADRLAGAVRRLAGRPVGASCVVIYYHEIMEFHRARFAAQMDALLRRATAISALDVKELPAGRHCVAVTVDDAFVSFFKNGWPELQRRRIPVTVFVPTALIGRKLDWAMEEKMDWPEQEVAGAAELQAMAQNPLIRFGSHTVNHRNLALLSATDARAELTDSRKTLEQLLKRPIESISFPYGAFTARDVDLAGQAGYTLCFTTTPAVTRDRSTGVLAGRVRVEPSDWSLEFALKLSGAYRWQTQMGRIRAWLKPRRTALATSSGMGDLQARSN